MKKYFNELKKKAYIKPLIFLILLLIVIPLGYTLTRFIMDKFSSHYIESKNFYFNSNRLKKNNPLYKINNWSGVGNFTVEVAVNSHKNNLLSSDFDVTYTVSYTCPADVICSIDKSEGVIYKASHTDTFTLTITPNKAFNDGESITIHIEATSTAPYVETISADFQIEVGKRGISYSIDDEVNRPYLLVSVTNALTYYTVKEAFGSYQIGDQIDSYVYKALPDNEKAKCNSALITLEFDPDDIILDITSSILNKSITEEQTINGIPYVKKITFPMDAMSSIEVRFYKVDYTKNYTYPFDNIESIVSFTAN